jgi:hypothetical protein
MFGSAILEVVIGLAFVYLLVSLVCSAVVEAVGAMLNNRGKTLEASLKLILGDKASEILAHPLIKSVVPNVKKPPHVDPDQFVSVIVNEVKKAQLAETKDKPLLKILEEGFIQTKSKLEVGTDNKKIKIPVKEVAPIVKVLELFLAETNNDLEKLRVRLKQWFEQEMDQLSAWYKRRTVAWLAVAATIFTFGLNVDSIALTKSLFLNPTQREKLTNLAVDHIKLEQSKTDASTPTGTKDNLPKDSEQTQTTTATAAVTPSAPTNQPPKDPLKDTKKALDDYINVVSSAEMNLGKPLQFPSDVLGIVSILFGYALTIAAASLGAPFWFDLLGKLVNLRLASKPEQTNAKKT